MSRELLLRFGLARALTLLILLIGFCAVLGLNLPGHLSVDSVVQLNDGRSGWYHTWHPPVMAWLLGLGDGFWRGAGVFVIANATLLFAILAGLVLSRPYVAWTGPIAAAAFVMSPLCLIYQGIVWKDVLYANASVAGFVLLGFYGVRLGEGRRAAGLLVGAFLLFALAALTRQNGFVSLVCGGGLLALFVARERGSAQARLALLWGAGAILASCAVVLFVSALLDTHRIDEPGAAAQFQALQQWDLIGGVAHDPKLDLTGLKPPSLQAMVRDAALHKYTPARVDPVASMKRLSDLLTLDDKDVSISWRRLIINDFPAYAAHRWNVFYWTLFTPDLDQCLPVFTGIDGPPALVKRLGLKNGQTPRDLKLEDYAGLFYRTPVFSHAAYAVMAILIIVVCARRGGALNLALTAMLVSALAFTASFVIISFACDYRYLYALDLSVMTTGLYLALGRNGLRKANLAAA